MISIIIPLYNKGELVRCALASVAAQDFSDYEVVIVDDGSTDNSVAEAQRFIEEAGMGNVRIVAQANAGVGAARNRGIGEARGEYVTFLDADDTWSPVHLNALANLAANYPACNVFATNYENMLPDGKVIPNRLSKVGFEGGTGVIDNYFEMAAASNPPLWTCAVMVRKDAIAQISGFPVGIKSGEDLLTWARLAARGDIAYDLNPTAVYHRGYSNPRPPERADEVGHQLEILYCECKKLPLINDRNTSGLKRYIALWYNMRMSRCLAHRMYGRAWTALCRSLRYHPTLRIARTLVKFTLLGLRK